MPAEINDKISIFVKDQFPEFYASDGLLFEKFVEAYYEYLEQTGQSLDYARNLIEYQDVDNTTAEFLDQFKKLYLEQLPGLIKADDRLTIKHIMDFYRAKGSERAIQLLFRLLFDEAATVSNPGEDVIKPSISDWRLPRYIEVYAPNMDNLIELEGLEIIGASSGAKGFVESISTKIMNGVKSHVIQLSNLRGNFLRGEIIAKTSDGIQDNMPIVTGSLSSVDITLGGQDFTIGDTFDLIADTGKQGQVRVTAVDNATGLIEYQFSNGGFGFSTNTSFTSVDVNTQHLEVNNVTNAAQSYSNSSAIDNAQFIKRERVDQHVEKLTYLSGSQMNEDMAALINAGTTPYLVGKKSDGTVVANGYVLSRTTTGANGTLFVAPFSGTFGNQLALSANLAVNTHIFEAGEPIDEESHVTLNISGTSGSFSVGDHVRGDSSSANGLVKTVNSTVMTVNGSFGSWSTEDNVQDITSGVANTANVTGVSVTTTGANGIISTFTNSNAKVYTLNIHEIEGAFTNGQKLKGRRTNTIASLTSSSDTGSSDIYIQGNNGSNASVDTYSNASVHAEVIGSNSTNVGFRNAKFANGSTGTFYQNTAAFIVGVDSNTYANVVTVGTGSGSSFKIGTLENEEAITIYTDFISDNNTANVAYLDCVIAGHESNTAGGNTGVGFVDTVDIRTAGSGYANGEVVTFATGGAGGGAPTTNATANVTTNGSGVITSTQVITAGAGFYSQNIVGTIATSGGSSGVLTANVDFGYGFPKDPNGDIDTVIDNVLTRFQGNIGSVATITDINPGNNYNFDPFVSVYTGGIAKFDRRDLVVNLTGMNQGAGGLYKDFTLGEVVNQTVTEGGQTLTLNTITVQNTSSSSNTTTGNTENFYIGSSVVQVKNSTVNAIGDVSSSNSTVINIKNGRVKTTFANGLISFAVNTQPFTSNSTINAISIAVANSANNETNVYSTVASNGSISFSSVSKGTVYKFNNNNDGTGDVGIRRLSFSVGFNETGTLTGATSGAGGTIDSLYQDANTRPIGDNFSINADAKAANGIVTDVEVIDSGFGYTHGANLTLRHTGNSNIVVSGTANVATTGLGPGYWASDESEMNAKYIHDNDYYQSHSYVVETGLSLDKYRDILLKSAHIAGTRLFGKVIRESSVNNAVTVSNSSIGAV
jgi:hypothetical protein